MEDLVPPREPIVPENEIELHNNINNINEDNFDVEEEDSSYDDDSEYSLMVLLPDEYGEPSMRLVELPSDLNYVEYYDGETNKDGDMPQDFMSDEEVEELLSNTETTTALKRKIKTRGRQVGRRSKKHISFRYRLRNRSDSPSRIRSRSPRRKRLSLTLSKVMRPER